MRKIAIIGSAAILLLLAGAIYFVNSGLPSVARSQALDILAAAGFKTVTMPEPQIRLGAVRYDRISLDADDISTIKRIEVRYNPLKLLFTRSLQSLYIEGLNLTGEMAADGTLTLSGWENPGTIASLYGYPLNVLTIEDAKISLMTEVFGGVSVDYSLQARRQKDEIKIQGNAKSGQKHLSFANNFSGAINEDGLWRLTSELEQGKFEVEPVKASRISGSLDLSGSPAGLTVLSELNAGGLTLYKFPWQNATSTIEKQYGLTKVFADMKSVGIDGIELSLSYENQDQAINEAPVFSGTLHAENFAQVLQYLKGLGMASATDTAVKTFERLTDAEISFSATGTETKIVDFTFSANGTQIPVIGRLQITKDGNYEGIVSGQPFFLQDFDKFLHGQDAGNGIFTGGQITLSGNVSKKAESLTNTMKMELAEGEFSFGSASLQGLTGPIVIEDFLSLSTEKPQALSCRLPVQKNIPQKCAVSIGINNGRMTAERLDAEFFGGKLSAKDYDFGPEIVIEAENIDLWELTSALGLEGLTATGRANATIPLILKDGKLFFKDAKITSAGKGVASFEYTAVPSFFKGDEFEQEAMKQALANYHYESFEIRLDGSTAEPEITIIGNGHNPDMLEQRPMALHLKTRALIAPLLKNIALD